MILSVWRDGAREGKEEMRKEWRGKEGSGGREGEGKGHPIFALTAGTIILYRKKNR